MVDSLETASSVLANVSDIEEILPEAQHRWFCPDEICEIIQNYKKFGITTEPPDKPQMDPLERLQLLYCGSLFLFDRKVLRYFRKDGHNWRKKKDRKAVMEAHQRLKAGSGGDLNCYYAHGEENENFQRRSYWMLDGEFSHIALVHYRMLTGKTGNFSCVKETQAAGPYSQETVENSETDGSMCSRSHPNNCQVLLENTDGAWLNIEQALEHENAQSVDVQHNHQASCGFHSGLELQQPDVENIDTGSSDPNVPLFCPNSFHESLSAISGIDLDPTQLDNGRSDNDAELTHDLWRDLDSTSWKDVVERCTPRFESIQHRSFFSSSRPDAMGKLFSNNIVKRLDFGRHLHIQGKPKVSVVDSSSLSKQPMDQKLHSESACDTTKFDEQGVGLLELMNSVDPQQKHPDIKNDNSMENYFLTLLSNEDHDYVIPQDSDGYLDLDGKSIHSCATGQRLFDGLLTEEGSKKGSSSGAWEMVEDDNENKNDVSSIPSQRKSDTLLLGPSLSQEQLFSIVDISPTWAYEGSKIKVLLRGRFLMSPHEVESCKWSCMFGEVEVPAEVMTGDLLCCHTPIHEAGRVPLYVTCSNKLACSEVREFEYRVCHIQDMWNDKSMKYGEHDQVLPLPSNSGGNMALEGNSFYSSVLIEEGLKEFDSFNCCMSKELRNFTDVEESHTMSCFAAFRETVENDIGIGVSSIPSEGQVQTFMLGPAMSQDQLFSIIDFSPNWAFVGSETKVLITGRFLKSPHVMEDCKWSCMFGKVEVPAEVIVDGVLRCHAPTHEASRVPFYVTCSSGLACSEVREFEYRTVHTGDINAVENYNGSATENFQSRFDKLLSLSSKLTISDTSSLGDIPQLSSKINTLLKEDVSEWEQMLKLGSGVEFSSEKLKELLFQKLLKEKLHVWLLWKVAESGKGPRVLDEGGQGVIHFAAALGFDWAFEPAIAAGVSVDFRDANGWTALHWAASCGREHTVASLISLGAAPGALTYLSTEYPLGRTPADLASVSRHKGIAGYLAERSLSVQNLSINLANKDNDAKGSKAVQEISERSATSFSLSNASGGLLLRDSLAAVCNATQAAAQIHQFFRVLSFEKRKLKEYSDGKFGMSNEPGLPLLAINSYKPGQDVDIHAAAIRIQNKFHSWKARKEFLVIRQRIIKIQAHVRGHQVRKHYHQVRKHYRKIIWCLGVMDKVILRWRRKSSGLSGFMQEAVAAAPNMHENSPIDDDCDFLKEGRKQVEERIQKALAKVKSMVQYPEGREQYHRLLNFVSKIQEKKVNSPGPSDLDEDLIDVEALLDDDSFMATAT